MVAVASGQLATVQGGEPPVQRREPLALEGGRRGSHVFTLSRADRRMDANRNGPNRSTRTNSCDREEPFQHPGEHLRR
jgi:hypothetical protein